MTARTPTITDAARRAPVTTWQITPWDDPHTDNHGWHPQGPASDEAWAAVVGTAAMTLYRALHRRIDATVDDETLAALITATPSRCRSTLDRLHRFGLIRLSPHEIQVRTMLPRLTDRQRHNLPAHHPLHKEQP